MPCRCHLWALHPGVTRDILRPRNFLPVSRRMQSQNLNQPHVVVRYIVRQRQYPAHLLSIRQTVVSSTLYHAAHIQTLFRSFAASPPNPLSASAVRVMNVQDPVDNSNNLTRGVSTAGLSRWQQVRETIAMARMRSMTSIILAVRIRHCLAAGMTSSLLLGGV